MYVLYRNGIQNDISKKILNDVAKIMNVNIIIKYYDGFEIRYFDKFFTYIDIPVAELLFNVIISNSFYAETLMSCNGKKCIFPYCINNMVMAKSNELNINIKRFMPANIDDLYKYLAKYEHMIADDIKLNETDMFELFKSNLKILENFDFSLFKKYYSLHSFDFCVDFDMFMLLEYIMYTFIFYLDTDKSFVVNWGKHTQSRKYFNEHNHNVWKIEIALYSQNGIINAKVSIYDILKYILHEYPNILNYTKLKLKHHPIIKESTFKLK